jgi:hypothetical protein
MLEADQAGRIKDRKTIYGMQNSSEKRPKTGNFRNQPDDVIVSENAVFMQ